MVSLCTRSTKREERKESYILGTARGPVTAPILPAHVAKDTIGNLDDVANPLPQGCQIPLVPQTDLIALHEPHILQEGAAELTLSRGPWPPPCRVHIRDMIWGTRNFMLLMVTNILKLKITS